LGTAVSRLKCARLTLEMARHAFGIKLSNQMLL